MNDQEIRGLIGFLGIVLSIIVVVFLISKGVYLTFDVGSILFIIASSLLLVTIQFPAKIMHLAITYLFSFVSTKKTPFRDYYNKILNWSRAVRVSGVLILEDDLKDEKESFVYNGLELLVNSRDSLEVESVLFREIERKKIKELTVVEVYRRFSLYMPLAGVWASMINMVQVSKELIFLDNLAENFIWSLQPMFYGIILGSIFMYTIYEQLKSDALRRARFHTMIAEGMVAISEGVNPIVLEKQLLIHLRL